MLEVISFRPTKYLIKHHSVALSESTRIKASSISESSSKLQEIAHYMSILCSLNIPSMFSVHSLYVH